MANSLGLVYSIASGVVTRTINPDNNAGDAHLDKVEAALHPGMAMIRIPKEDVGADEGNCPRVAELIAHVNASKSAPSVPLQKGVHVAILNQDKEIVDFLLGCPTLIHEVAVPDKYGEGFAAVEITPDRKATISAGGKDVRVPPMLGSKYDAVNDKFEATDDQIAEAVATAELGSADVTQPLKADAAAVGKGP